MRALMCINCWFGERACASPRCACTGVLAMEFTYAAESVAEEHCSTAGELGSTVPKGVLRDVPCGLPSSALALSAWMAGMYMTAVEKFTCRTAAAPGSMA